MIGDFFLNLLHEVQRSNLHVCTHFNVAEIGVRAGRTSKNLLSNPLVHLWMVDPWKPLEDYDRWSLSECEAQCRKAMWDTNFAKYRRHIVRKTSKGAIEIAKLGNFFFDMVILDANHKYDHVVFDIKNWYERLNVGGIMSGRFYGKIDGVTKAVDEYCTNNKIELHTNESHGWWFIKEMEVLL